MIAFSLLAAAALTQAGPMQRWGDVPAKDAREIFNAYARCTVRNEPELSRKFVLMRAGERLPESEFQRLFAPDCLGFLRGQMRMRPWRARTALAESLIVRGPVRLEIASFAEVPPLDWSSVPATDPVPTEGPIVQAEAQLGALGECVARANPVAVAAVFRSRADSKDEMTRLRGLAPTIAGCVSKGQTIAFNRTNLRAGLALAYYRLAMSAPVAPAPAGTR